MKPVLLLNGPNLNLLGQRDPFYYGDHSLDDIVLNVREFFESHSIELESYQSNHEGDLIDQLHRAHESYSGVLFNPGAYTHTSVALRDAVEAIAPPVIEVHISNVHNREKFREKSFIAPVSAGQIVGFGVESYLVAAFAMTKILKKERESINDS
ncbi:type II 3-dehydroquinate dehydratase [Piscibacillus salipiscarius]|uniref:3-dehydroquinate dehydratase n=1 Tax=Piscibacillus salipiscarius TaxID=299480 RepID=A0ABW5Q6J8_9BACI|nr:type II 3-dehydroquinate dehydratase [Piscibacillus salipiscarius]